MKYIALAAILLMLSPAAYSGGKDRGGHKKIFRQLDLSEDQKKGLQKLQEESWPKMKELKGQKKALHKEMKEAMKSNADDSSLQKIHDQLKSIRNKMGDLQFKKMLKVRSLLNEEQRAKYMEFMAKKRRRGGRGR